jgi:hypothetical protein
VEALMTLLLLNILGATAGFATLYYGIYSAVVDANPYWYSYFVVGSFLLFDRLDMLLNDDSNLTRLFSKKWRTPIFTYLTYVALAILIDYLMGRLLSNMWVYPHFDELDEIVHVIIIGYPFGLFSCSAFFRVLNSVFRRLIISHSRPSLLEQRCLRQIAKVLLLSSILSFLLPIANFALFNNKWVHELMFICVVLGMSSISPIALLLRLPSFLGRILNRDCATIATLIVTIPINALTNEIPNTYAWEWRYQNLPFTSFEIMDVNILILTVGWSYLTILGVSTNDLFFQWKSKIED